MDASARARTVGFVGLGAMGAPMAANVLRHGHALVVHDADAARTALLAQQGAAAAADPAAVARQAAVLVCMLDTTAHTEQAIFGARGFAQALQTGDLVIVMGTVDVLALRDWHARLAGQGVELVDAPVTGMRNNGAATASIRCYAGGSAEAVERARPLLRTMTAEVTRFGAIGAGTAMKTVNNLLMQVNRVVVAEALALGARAGLDPQQMVETVSRSTGNSAAFQANAPRMLARDFDGLPLDITTHDVGLQADLGRGLGMPLFMTSMALQVHQTARAMGLGALDAAALVRVYEQFTGVPVVAKAEGA